MIAAAILLILPNEDALYLKAKEAMATGDDSSVVKFDDAKRMFLLPYLEQYPEGKHVQEVRGWLDDAEVAILERQAENMARGKRDGRNRHEKDCIAALQAERDKDRNLLESIELFQLMLSSLDNASSQPPVAATDEKAASGEAGGIIGDPKYWRMLAERHLKSQKNALLTHSERNRIITERMTAADKLLTSDKPEDGQQILTLFRDIFRSERDLDPWLDYARFRQNGEPAEMPKQ